MKLQSIKLLQEVGGGGGVIEVCPWPCCLSGVFIWKMPAKHTQVCEWDAVTGSFTQPGDEPQKIVSLVG